MYVDGPIGNHSVKGSQLQALVDCVESGVAKINMPLKQEVWRRELADHPDGLFAVCVIHDITEGFRIGFELGRTQLKGKDGNMQSVLEHKAVVAEYLAGELAEGRIALAGTTDTAKWIEIHCSPFGVIPKKNKPGKFRLILN